MAAYGLYTHIASNKFRSMLLLAGLFLLIYVLVFAGALLAEVLIHSDASVDYYLRAASRDLVTAFPYATIVAALWIVIAYFFHQNMIDAVTGGEDVTRQQQPRLYNLLENLCISRGIPMPKLKVMDSPALNAFASGLNRRQYAVTVTTGLAEGAERPGDRGGARPRADPYPQRRRAADGDRGHHRRRGRLLRRTVLSHVHQPVVEFERQRLVIVVLVVSSSSSDSDSKGSGGGGAIIVVIIAVALILLAWLLSQVVKLALSRSRELLADAGSVELTKNPDAMITALRKIENRGELPGATSAVMELCVDNPREGFADLFATHPSVDSRVKALVQFAGGHDPGPLALPSDTADEPEEPDGTGRRAIAAAGSPRPVERCRRAGRRSGRPVPARRRALGAGTAELPPLARPAGLTNSV